MATLLQLVQGTRKVVDTSFKRASLPQEKLKISQVNVMSLKGMKVKHITALIDSATEDGKKYKIWMIFTGLDNPGKEKPSTSKTRVYVRCNCLGYYFYFSYANKINKSLAGIPMRPYQRVKPDSGRPPLNPKTLPGSCKHLIFATVELLKMGLIK